VSGEYYALMWRRAERFLLRASRDLGEGDYDGACFNAEEATQLALKVVLYKYFGELPRVHGSRTLLARLRNLLMDAGRGDVASIMGGSCPIVGTPWTFWRRATPWLGTGSYRTARPRGGYALRPLGGP